MAPSPTGPLHIGSARTAFFNLLFARHEKGTFILRIEDTDKERSKPEHEIGLIEGLHWLGIDWDEGPNLQDGKLISKGDYGPYRQSERIEIHKKYIAQFLAEGKAYQCYCTKEDLDAQRQESEGRGVPFRYPRTCRNLEVPPSGKTPQAIRLRMPDEAIAFTDLIRGKVVVKASELDDFAIARSDGSPLFNFAVAIDDYQMKITHVVRGEDHISNTPKQIAVYQALGAEPPLFAHLPLILNPDRSKMSKRFADTALADYRAKGYLPGAIVNFLALLGWHPKDDKELFAMDELATEFDLSRVQKAGAVFNQDKLDWLNREYLKKLSDAEIAGMLKPFFKEQKIEVEENYIEKIVRVERSRAATLSDFIEQGKFFFAEPEYTGQLLVWKDTPRETVGPILKEIHEKISSLLVDENLDRDTLIAALDDVVKNHSKGEVFWPLRVALSGLASSPDPVDIMIVLGKGESLKRIEVGIKKVTSGQ